MSAGNKVDGIMVRVFIALLVVVLLILIPFFSREKSLYHLVLLITLDLGLVASLIANFVLYRRIRILRGDDPPAKKKSKRSKKAARAAAPRLRYDPKDLPDPGLIFRFDLSKSDGRKRIVIGQTEGTIKTFSTEIINGHLEFELRVKDDPDKDIYEQSKAIVQNYQIDLRRGGRAMIYYPGMERFREMDARERIVVQPEADQSGDFQFDHISAKNPIRFQIGDRLRHDGKFSKGYFEFHLFTKDHETEVAGYKRLDKMFFLRIYKIFPGYDTAHPDDEGLYPMIDPYVSR